MSRRCFALLVPAAAVLLAHSPAASAEDPAPAHSVEARVDLRVELLSIVFRLAGNPEYGRGQVPAYTQAVEAKFGKLRGHQVVKHAEALRRQHGVSFDAVMSLAVHLDPDFRLSMEPEQAQRLDRRWPTGEARTFVEELRAFAKVGDAPGFFRSQHDLFDLTAKRAQAVLDEHLHLGWFDTFFGARPRARFALTLGLGNGGSNYGPSVLRADGREELDCILGVWATDAGGDPTFSEDVVPTVVHEFCHSYCNALVDAHLGELSGPGGRLWPHVADAMREQAYGEPATMLRESLVRACVVRYRAASEGAEAAAREIAEQHARSFLWTGELAALLAGYERERTEYASLDAFMPRLAAFFAEYATRFEERMAATPKVAKLEPPNGAKDVDPATKAIVVTFDRPMLDGAWAVVGGGPHYPGGAGRPSYDESRRVLTIPVELRPGWSYEFWLNRGEYDSFQSAEGVKLQPVHVTFATRAK